MGVEPHPDRRHFRFGVFELDTATGELRKHGVRVRLQDQPLKFLLCLLGTPGEVFTREELIYRIWPEGTFVDYDRGLNSAATRLRQVLGDTADAPRYIETLGRKGYRFIAPVEHIPNPERSPMAPAAEGPALPQSPAPDQQAQGNTRMPWRLWSHLAVLGVGLAAGAGVGWWRVRQPILKPLVRLSVDLDAAMTPAGNGARLALAPDGSRLAVTVRSEDGRIRLATRRLDQGHFTLLPGTEGASAPFFSPDGQWIAFFADNKLRKIGVQGGTPVSLADAATFMRGPRGRFPDGSWGDGGDIIAMLNPSAGLMRVPATGGTPAPLIGLKRAEGEVDTWPQLLPGSQALLFTRHTGDYESASLEILSFKTGQQKTLLKGGFFGRYLPGGYLAYIRRNTLFAVSFDPSTLVSELL
ncbi:MAG: winged helix-turn-helix domain-containing protein [Bryobacterales bacterium]|nr:winged helix-turn-helix domain-containing protein [Bryobacterales bacterium]